MARTVRVQVRFNRPDLRLIEVLARNEGIARSEWIRRVLAAAVGRITEAATPSPNANAEPRQVRRALTTAGDGLGRRDQA